MSKAKIRQTKPQEYPLVTSPWQLMTAGRFREAIDAYTTALRERPRATDYSNRGLAHLALKDYAAAGRDFRQCLELTPQTDHGFIFLGVCQWGQNLPGEAVSTWKQGLQAQYSDAAGGVELPATLLYAALRLQDDPLLKESTGLLRRMSRRKSLQQWPGAIVPYLLGKIDEDGLRAAADAGASSQLLLARHRCQVEFFAGVRSLLDGNHTAFQRHMQECSRIDCQLLEHVYFLAIWESDHAFRMPV